MPRPAGDTEFKRAVELLVPLAAATAATQEEGGGVWVAIMPAGRWVASHLASGIYEITPANLAEIVANFDRKAKPTAINAREGHWGTTPALGWIEELKADQNYLYARVVWTDLGRAATDSQHYRYCSPGWFDLETPYVLATTGEKIPWVLDHLALTNDPFFTELPAAAERADGMVIYTVRKTAEQEPVMPDPQPPPDAAAENTRLRADNLRLTQEAEQRENATQLASLEARFAAVQQGDRIIAPAHAKALATSIMDLPADKREAAVVAQLAALEKGFVPVRELGGTSPITVTSEGISPALLATARRLGLGAEFVHAAANRGPGGALDVAGSRIAVGRMAPQTAAAEIPTLSYQETMVLVEGFFVAGYETAAALNAQFSNRVVSSQRTIDYRALGAPPRMREWLSEIQGRTFNAASSFPVTVRDWEATVELPVSQLQADLLGQYALKVQQMGAFARQHPDELIAALFAAAETTLCYDGQYLCDTDHSEGASGTQSNLLTTGGDSDDVADIAVDLGTAIAAFNRFKDDRGQYLRIGSAPQAVFDVVCRPEDLPFFDKIATAENITTSASNQWKGRIRPLAIPELSTADEWFILWTNGPVKPFIVQYQNEPSAIKTLGPDSEHCRKTGNVWFSTQGNYTVAPGDWRYIIKIQKA